MFTQPGNQLKNSWSIAEYPLKMRAVLLAAAFAFRVRMEPPEPQFSFFFPPNKKCSTIRHCGMTPARCTCNEQDPLTPRRPFLGRRPMVKWTLPGEPSGKRSWKWQLAQQWSAADFIKNCNINDDGVSLAGPPACLHYIRRRFVHPATSSLLRRDSALQEMGWF